jgi:diguanylate cyclase (GGDEF)-like protein/PAS domain S-box-containing protein
MSVSTAFSDREKQIRLLFDEYIEMYASRDDRLVDRFSDDFSGYTGGGNFLVKDRHEWVKITRQDFAQVPGRIRIEMLDLSLQDIGDNVVVTTGFFHIHLPGVDQILSREVARLVLIFRLEGVNWKIVHSGISIPYHLVQENEVYPIKGLKERNSALEILVDARTRALHESEALYRQLTEDIQDVLWKTDKGLFVTYISPADEHLRGFKASEVVGRHVFEMFTEQGVELVKNIMRQSQVARQTGTSSEFLSFEVQHRCKNGQLIWGEVLSRPEFDAQGVIVGYHGITREITKRKELEEQVRQLAFYDGLTQLPNRRLLHDRLGQLQEASRRRACYAALMFLDLDNFKPINDAYGHGVGDCLLKEVANRLTGCVRAADTVSRFGGDEFVVLIGELTTDKATSSEQARLLAEKIRTRLAEPYRLMVSRADGIDTVVEHFCSVSIGVVVFAGVQPMPEDILKHADTAMYRAKDAGRNSISFVELLGDGVTIERLHPPKSHV